MRIVSYRMVYANGLDQCLSEIDHGNHTREHIDHPSQISHRGHCRQLPMAESAGFLSPSDQNAT